MPTFLTAKQWGRAKARLPKNVAVAKAKKKSKVARAGQAALAVIDSSRVKAATSRKKGNGR